MGFVAPNFLGWAVEPAKEMTLTEQYFDGWGDGSMCSSQKSSMIWRKDMKQIYFLVWDNFGLHAEACQNWWQLYDDNWQPGQSNNEDITAPPGKIVPVMGFGKVWRQHLYQKRPGLGNGFATTPETAFEAVWQRFENGSAIYRKDTQAIYVLFDSYDYVTRSGLDKGRKVWFNIKK